MPIVITDNAANKATGPLHTPIPMPQQPAGPLFPVVANFQTLPAVTGAVMNSLGLYAPDATHLNGCGIGPVPPAPPPLTGVFVNKMPIHYGGAPLGCGSTAGIGSGFVFCYERVPNPLGPVILQ